MPCEHGKQFCRVCDRGYCPHKIQKSRCKPCLGDKWKPKVYKAPVKCVHGNKNSCRVCLKGSYCEHKKLTYRCRSCMGTSFKCQVKKKCNHGKQRHHCKTCMGDKFRIRTNGSQWAPKRCPHGRQKHQCRDLPLSSVLKSPRFCTGCAAKLLSVRRKYTGICAECDASTPPRLEHIVRNLISDKLPKPTFQDDKLIGGATCGAERTRPDLCWLLPDRIVHVEIDEDSHEDRAIDCELKKLDSANWGLSDYGLVHLPTVTVRFNCSAYNARRIGLEERCKSLVKVLKVLLEKPTHSWDPLRTNVIYMYYHSKANKHIEAARAAQQSVVVRFVVK